ncbi:MAG: Nif3-like dinuclear metal center hexameric protein [Bradymonadia bacterium]
MAHTQREVLTALDTLAPLVYAESWDNVGLLVDPPAEERTIGRVGFTIDLTDGPHTELLDANVDLVVAYHPPIFGGLKRLKASQPGPRRLMQLIQRGIPVYSPHTALDAVPGGVADWLAEGLGEAATIDPITPSKAPLPVHEGQPVGAGRRVKLSTPTALTDLIPSLKAHLGLAHVRVAMAPAHAAGAPITTAAVCPGAGGSLFGELRGHVDLLVTGEMRHHDILSRVGRGTSVIVTDHTNTERGYLPVMAQKLARLLPGLEVIIATADRDPLEVV